MNNRHSTLENLEEAGYFIHEREQLYYVLHPTNTAVKARVLLAGPFASERSQSYIPWVRWARHLACNGYEVLRIDYRGVGESTGHFEEYGFNAWEGDLIFCANWLMQRSPAAPLVIHGLGMGGLLAEQLFRKNIGDIMLLWLTPKNAREMMYEQLKIKLSNNFSLPASERKCRDDYISELENGQVVEVEGNNWTPRLWTEAADYFLADESSSVLRQDNGRRLRYIEDLGPLESHIFGGIGLNPLRLQGRVRLLNPDLRQRYEMTVAWLNSALQEIRAK